MTRLGGFRKKARRRWCVVFLPLLLASLVFLMSYTGTQYRRVSPRSTLPEVDHRGDNHSSFYLTSTSPSKPPLLVRSLAPRVSVHPSSRPPILPEEPTSTESLWRIQINGESLQLVPFLEEHDGLSYAPRDLFLIRFLAKEDECERWLRDTSTESAFTECVCNIQSAVSGTFLSRDVVPARVGSTSLARVVLDKLEARSSEKWQFVPSNNKRRLFELRGVASLYQPDADQWCVYSVASHPQEFFMRHHSQGCSDASLELVKHLDNMTQQQRWGKQILTDRIVLAVVLTNKPLRALQTGRDLQRQIYQHWTNMVEALNRVGILASLSICVDDEEDRIDVNASLSSQSATRILVDCERHEQLHLPTYRGLFSTGEEAAARLASPSRDKTFVLVTNADVVMRSSQLHDVLRAIGSPDPPLPLHGVLVTGRRWNCRNTQETFDALVYSADVTSRGGGGEYGNRRCTLFGDDAEDYFLISYHLLQWKQSTHGDDPLLKWSAADFRELQKKPQYNRGRDLVPPFVVGGVAFDNWLVATVAEKENCAVIDATAALDVWHFGGVDAVSLRGSHKTRSSRFNSEVAHYTGGWANGKVSSQSLVLLPSCRSCPCFIHQRGALRREESPRARAPWIAKQHPSGDAFDEPWREVS